MKQRSELLPDICETKLIRSVYSTITSPKLTFWLAPVTCFHHGNHHPLRLATEAKAPIKSLPTILPFFYTTTFASFISPREARLVIKVN
jgi:hypothetical protein